MDLIKLKYFIAAAELLNFSKAAEACNITQTAIGKYINKLENENYYRAFQFVGRK